VTSAVHVATWMASALAAGAGLGALCWAARSQRARMAWPAHTARQRLGWRAGGWLLLAASWALAWCLDGPALGSVLWVVQLGVAGLLLVITLPWWSRRLRAAVVAAAGVSMLGAAWLIHAAR
jgi:hypothetical protein